MRQDGLKSGETPNDLAGSDIEEKRQEQKRIVLTRGICADGAMFSAFKTEQVRL